jgi:hypothetical protein
MKITVIKKTNGTTKKEFISCPWLVETPGEGR